MRRLDESGRAIVVLHYFLGMPLTDVAATLGIPIGTVKSRLHRALGEMRVAVETEPPPPSPIPEGRSHDHPDAPRTRPARASSTTCRRARPPNTSMTSSCGPAGCGSGLPGRSPKGGSPWLISHAARAFAPAPPLRPIALALVILACSSPARWRTSARGRQAVPAPFGPAAQRADPVRLGRRHLRRRPGRRARAGSSSAAPTKESGPLTRPDGTQWPLRAMWRAGRARTSGSSGSTDPTPADHHPADRWVELGIVGARWSSLVIIHDTVVCAPVARPSST